MPARLMTRGRNSKACRLDSSSKTSNCVQTAQCPLDHHFLLTSTPAHHLKTPPGIHYSDVSLEKKDAPSHKEMKCHSLCRVPFIQCSRLESSPWPILKASRMWSSITLHFHMHAQDSQNFGIADKQVNSDVSPLIQFSST